jgi:site-specific DNA recombinase
MLIIKDSESRNKAVAYIRVSSQRQVDEGVSLEAQKRRILDYCKYKDIPLSEDDIIVEEGVSGGIPLWDRPKGRAMKRKLASGQYQHLISMKIDRLFRVTSDMLTTVDELNDAGIDLHIVDMKGQAIDSTTAFGRMFLTIVGAMAEMERGLISERTQEGMNQLKAMNKKFTHSIYGWNETSQGSVVPNWDEQHIIDYMYWQVEVNGMSATSVAKHLNREQIKGKRGGNWSAGSVLKVIRNIFHEQRKRFPNPAKWGNKLWHRWL